MPSFTKKAIKESFLKLLNERPISQITVRDVVEDCGINRNSFYYHYQDLQALVVEILRENTDRILAEVPGVCRVCYELSPKPCATIEWE